MIQVINFPGLLSSRGVWTVDSTNGSDTGSGRITATATGAVGKASPGDTILLTPGTYRENIVIPRQKPGLTIVSVGDRHSGILAPDAGAPLIVHADDTRLINLGIEAPDGETALRVLGARVRAYLSKIEGGAACAVVGPGAEADVSADAEGDGADVLFEECEFAWSALGLVLRGSDYGAATQARVRRSRFHNISDAHIAEEVGAGGSAPVTFRDFEASECSFLADEAGAAPTRFIDLDGDAGNTGRIARCDFAYATNEADVIAIAAGVLFVANMTEAGMTTARPS